MGRTALTKSAWNGEDELLKELLNHRNINLELQDSKGRTPLHMAAWGQYGGRNRKKASVHVNDSPKCCLYLL
jgi:hypothetical protein